MARVLVIDDDAEIRALLRLYLEKAGHVCIAVDGAQRALPVLTRDLPDLVITDIMMPGPTGDEIYDYIRSQFGRTLPVIISTGRNLKFRDNGDPYLAICPKQNDYGELMEAVESLLAKAGIRG